MKKIYLTLLFICISFFASAQGEILVGNWELNYISLNGSQIESTISDNNYNLNFSSDVGNEFGFLAFGNVCYSYGFDYEILSENSISVNNLTFLTLGCEIQLEEDFFFNYRNILNPNTTNSDIYTHDYSINISGTEAELTITNENGDFIVYNKRLDINSTDLFGNWFLHSRTNNGVTTTPPLTAEENYNIVLSFGLEPPSSGNPLIVNSYGPSTDSFYGNFLINNDKLIFNNIYESLGNFCDHPPEVCDYFDNYNYDILFNTNSDTPLSQYFASYQVAGTGNDAILTITNDFNGDYAVYGRQVLSNTDFERKQVSISPNPTKGVLYLTNINLNSKYSIYSIEGKEIIFNSKLQTFIDVSNFQKGIYFIKIDNKQVIKFVKH